MSDDHQNTPRRQSNNSLLNLLLLIGVVAAVGVVFAAMLVEDPRLPGVGGLPPGTDAPPIQAVGWVNGEPPDLPGKVVVVDAWATWCGPCWQAAPELVSLYQTYHPRGVVFVGLTDEGPEVLDEIRQFVEKNDIEWPNGYGALTTLQQFQVAAIPALWVIGRDGKVVWNRDSEESIQNAIETALAQ